MAVAATDRLTAGNSANAASYATASVTPSGNTLQLLWIYAIGSALPNTPTVTGNGLTWVLETAVDDGSGVRKLFLFRALGAAPSAGAITIDFGGQVQIGCVWSLAECASVDTSGTNGSGAIVQAVTNFSAVTVGNLTVTMAAMSGANNLFVGGFGIPYNNAAYPEPTSGTGYTLLGHVNQGSPNQAISSEYGTGTTMEMDCGTANLPWVGIGVEVQYGTAAPVHNAGMDFFAVL